MRIPITIKFSALIFLLVVVITSVIFWFTLYRVREALTQEIKLQGEILANVIALNAEDPIIAKDDLYLVRLVNDAIKNEGVSYTYIVDSNQVILAHDEMDWIGRSADSIIRPENTYHVTRPIVLAGKKEIGEVHVGLNIERIIKITNNMQIILILISVMGLILGTFGAMLLSRYLTRPIHELVNGFKAIANGDLRQVLSKKADDEIGDLMSAFNEMTRSLMEKEQIKDAFRRYVSRQVAEEIFKNPDQYIETLRGSRRKVTILFADIRGFTPLTERLSAEDVVTLLNEVLTSMTKVIFKHEGTVDKFIGDSIMAVFGAPIAHVDDTDRSIHAAVEIQRAIQEMSEQRKREEREIINVGIGINSGEVVVGNIGAKVRLDYTVIGGSVNIANRLQEVAGGGEIIISESVFKETTASYKYSEPMLIKVKGKEEPIKIYRVLY
jgi:adenylate cyclase